MSSRLTFSVVSPTTVRVGEVGVRLEDCSREVLIKVLNLMILAHSDQSKTHPKLWKEVKPLREFNDIVIARSATIKDELQLAKLDADLRVVLLQVCNTWYQVSKNERVFGNLITDVKQSREVAEREVKSGYNVADKEDFNVQIKGNSGALSLASTSNVLQQKVNELKATLRKLRDDINACSDLQCAQDAATAAFAST